MAALDNKSSSLKIAWGSFDHVEIGNAVGILLGASEIAH